MKHKYIITFLLTLSFAWTQKCPENINLLPMYGRQKKCQQQIEADNRFLEHMDQLFKKDRKKASKDRVDKAWQYFYANILDTSMMRFNQAWLLDSTNADVYWGFGNLLGRQQKFKESLLYFEKSLKLNPNNSNAWLSASTSYGQLFYQSKDVKLLNTSIDYLKKAVAIDPTNARAYGQLTAAYSYFAQKDSARKYLEITDKLDPRSVHPEVRKSISGK